MTIISILQTLQITEFINEINDDLLLYNYMELEVPYGISQSGTTGTNAFSSPYDVSVKMKEYMLQIMETTE